VSIIKLEGVFVLFEENSRRSS